MRELLERQAAVDRMPAQDDGGLLTLGIRGANGWSLVAQVSRSLYCDGTFFANEEGVSPVALT